MAAAPTGSPGHLIFSVFHDNSKWILLDTYLNVNGIKKSPNFSLAIFEKKMVRILENNLFHVIYKK